MSDSPFCVCGCWYFYGYIFSILIFAQLGVYFGVWCEYWFQIYLFPVDCPAMQTYIEWSFPTDLRYPFNHILNSKMYFGTLFWAFLFSYGSLCVFMQWFHTVLIIESL